MMTLLPRRAGGKRLSWIRIALCVLAVMLLCAIVIPVTWNCCGTREQRMQDRMIYHAQCAVSMYGAARTCGVTRIPLSSKEALLQALEAGVTVEDPASPFAGKRLGIGKVNSDVREGTKRYMRITEDGVEFVPAGGDSGA